MDTREAIKAKADLEHRLFLFLSNEIKTFQDNTGIPIEKIDINFYTFYTTCGDVKSLGDVKVKCKF